MANLEDSISTIPKLNSSNYSTRKFRIEMLLIKEDLISFVEDNPPAAPDKKYQKCERQVHALINLLIEDSQIIHVKYETTAKVTWDKLKKIHERVNLLRKFIFTWKTVCN